VKKNGPRISISFVKKKARGGKGKGKARRLAFRIYFPGRKKGQLGKEGKKKPETLLLRKKRGGIGRLPKRKCAVPSVGEERKKGKRRSSL